MSAIDLPTVLRDFHPTEDVTEAEIAACEAVVGMPVPPCIRATWLAHGAGEGWLGGSFIDVWSPSLVASRFVSFALARALPGVWPFAGDGGGEIIGIDVLHGGCVVAQGMDLDPGTDVVVALSLREFFLLPDAIELAHAIRRRVLANLESAKPPRR